MMIGYAVSSLSRQNIYHALVELMHCLVVSLHEYRTINANFTQFMHFATNHALIISV